MNVSGQQCQHAPQQVAFYLLRCCTKMGEMSSALIYSTSLCIRHATTSHSHKHIHSHHHNHIYDHEG